MNIIENFLKQNLQIKVNLKNNMKMEKKTLIFDTSVIAENLTNGRGRSGIYFTSFNILKSLISSNAFDIKLYSSNLYDKDFINFIHEKFGDNIEIYFGNKYGILLKKLQNLDLKLHESHHNILKLLLNIFIRKPLQFIGSRQNLPEFDVAFSPCRIFDKNIKARKKYIL